MLPSERFSESLSIIFECAQVVALQSRDRLAETEVYSVALYPLSS